MWNQGIHARSGVACADCHMPTCGSGAQKISDHQVRSPAAERSRTPARPATSGREAELKARVETDPGPHFDMRNLAMDALVALIGDLEGRRRRARADAELARRRATCSARAQFYLDFVEAENSTGFHAPQEALADPRRLDRLRAPGAARAARPVVQAGREGRRRPDGAARPEPGDRDAARGERAAAGEVRRRGFRARDLSAPGPPGATPPRGRARPAGRGSSRGARTRPSAPRTAPPRRARPRRSAGRT